MSLDKETCEVCHQGGNAMDEAEINTLLEELPEWKAVVLDGVMQLQREFMFNNFKKAMAFTNKVGDMAEEQDHHPAILLEWGKVTVNWWSHNIRGLHQNDFICASKCDALFAQ